MEVENSELVTSANGEAIASEDDVNSEVELVKEVSTKITIKQVLQKFRKDDEPSGDNAMKKEINLITGIAYIAGGMIGSGIFITPNRILALTHSFGLSLIVWVLGSIMATLAALCYIELALVVRKSGAEFSYIKEAYSFRKKHWSLELLGSILAYMFFWTSTLVVRAPSLAIITLTSARYLVRPFYIGCNDLPEKAVVLLALALLGILALVNCFGLKFAARMMSFFTFCKIFTVVFIMILGVISVIIRRNNLPSSFLNPFENLNGEAPSLSSVALSLYSVQFAYDGWYNLSSAVEETKNVKRTLPLSVYIGVAIVTVSYLVVNVSFFAVLSFDQIESAIAVALPFGKETLGTAGLVIIPIMVSASAFGAANGTLFIGSRILFVTAREGLAPKFMSGLHSSAKTPVPAILFVVAVAMVAAAVGTIKELIDGVEFMNNVFYGLCIVAVFILRVTHSKEPRIFSAWFIIPVAIAAALFTLFLLIIPVIHSLGPPMIGLGVTLSAIPVYLIFVMEKPYKIRPKFMERLSDFISKYVTYIFNTQPTASVTKQEASVKYSSN